MGPENKTQRDIWWTFKQQSVASKTEQLEHLLTDSNVDYLCLTETWLTSTTLLAVSKVIMLYKVTDKTSKGKGGGVLIYVKESMQSKQLGIDENILECVWVTITLSPEMSFVVFAVY